MKYEKTIQSPAGRLMLSCEEAALMTSNSFHKKLTFFERQKLRWHLLICKPCREYKHAHQMINKGIRSVSRRSNKNISHHLTHAKKEELKKLLKQV